MIGEYEIACAEVIFSNTLEIDLGEVEIEFFEASPRYSARTKITGYLGETLINIIGNINKPLLKTTIEFEYKRRLRLRKKYKVEETEHIFYLGGVSYLLPLPDNDIYNSVVNEDIPLLSPKLELNDKFVFYRNTSNYKITLHGNINNYINYTTDNLKHKFNIKTNRLPDFNTIILLTDLVANENFGNSSQPVIKIFNLEKRNESQTKVFELSDQSYKRVKKKSSA